MGKRKIFSMLVMMALVISMFTNAFIFGPLVMISKANPGDISDSYYNETTLNVTVLEREPRVNWYDFQFNNSGSWESRLNQQVDTNNSAEYRFCVNISSDQGWADIEYINITAWHDGGDDIANNTYFGAGGHNSSYPGGNINLFLQYENTTGTAIYTMVWPGDEVTIGAMTETNVSDPNGTPGYTECHNLTFSFTPGYQWRYAPGDALWEDGPGYNDTWSWNFNITCDDASGYHSYNNPTSGETIDEFGVYSYTEIVSAGWPVIAGNPDTTASVNDAGGSGNITIQTRSNGNYSLSVNVTNLTHTGNPSYTIQNTSIQTRGGDDIASLTNFNGNNPQYYYNGSGAGYTSAENDSTSKTTNNIEWAVQIPAAQQPGDYEAQIFYHLKTET